MSEPEGGVSIPDETIDRESREARRHLRKLALAGGITYLASRGLLDHARQTGQLLSTKSDIDGAIGAAAIIEGTSAGFKYWQLRSLAKYRKAMRSRQNEV